MDRKLSFFLPNACRYLAVAALSLALTLSGHATESEQNVDSAPVESASFGSVTTTAENVESTSFASITPSAQEQMPPPEVELPNLSEPDSEVLLPVRESTNSDVVDSSSSAAAITSSPRRFQYAFQLTVRGIYDDNINLFHEDPISDFYFVLDPAVVLAFGDAGEQKENYVLFDYRPRIYFFMDHDEANAFEHVIRLEGQYVFRKLRIRAIQEIQLLDGLTLDIREPTGQVTNTVNLDVSGRTNLNQYLTVLQATYDLSAKTFLTGGVGYLKADYPELNSTESFNTDLNINYHYSPKLDVGIGGQVGIDTGEETPDQLFERVKVRLGYNATGKLVVVGSVGLEFRQVDGGEGSNEVSPVFSLGVTYKPFDGTTITLNGSRNTYVSAVFAGQNYNNTSIRLTARQRLFRRVTLGLNVGFETSEYYSTVDGITATRDDDYFFIQPGIDVKITRFWALGAFYLHRRNTSSVESFGFESNQFGVQSSLTF